MKIGVIHDPGLDNSENIETKGIDSYHNQVTTSIAFALKQHGHDVTICEVDFMLKNQLQRIKPEFVFNTSIKKFNGSSKAFAPEILEKLAIPYTGPSAAACSNAYDKRKSIEILKKAGIHTPKAIVFKKGDEIIIPDAMVFPLFVKPQKGGCSFGISKLSLILTNDHAVNKIQTAIEDIGAPVIVEEFLSGREFTVGILGNKPPRILPILEFFFKSTELPYRSFLRKMADYEIEDKASFAYIKNTDKISIEKLAVSAFKALECRDYARIDIRLNEFGIPNVIEINAIPNLEPKTSSFAIMAKEAGISFSELIEKIVSSSLKRYSLSNL